MPDDASVIADVLAGRTERFRLLVERYQGPVFAIARSFAGNGIAAEDIAQEAFLRALSKLHQFSRERGSFRAWLLTIARNHGRDMLRRAPGAPLDETRLEAPPRAHATTEVLGRLDTALAALSPERRMAFLLVDVYDLPQDEVARIVDVPVGTIKSRAARARQAIRAELGPLVEDPR